MGSEHHSFPPPPHLLKHMICHDASQAELAPRLCRALPPRRCRSPPPRRPPPPPGSPARSGRQPRLRAAPCSGLKEIVFVHTKPFVSARGSPAFSQTAGNSSGSPAISSPGGGGLGGETQQKVTLANRLPDSCRLGSRSAGGGGAGRPGSGQDLLSPRLCPPSLAAPARPPPQPPPAPRRCCARAGYFSQDVTSKWHNLWECESVLVMFVPFGISTGSFIFSFLSFFSPPISPFFFFSV